jgi:alkylation response protein AidB-like acyl-CoA dehydrogenase
MALERIKEDDSSDPMSSLAQTTAMKVADLGTRLWVAGQVTRGGTQLVKRGTTSEKILSLGKSFVTKASLEVCHQAMELLRAYGLTDDGLLSNYSAVLQISAQDRSFESPQPPIAEGS